MDNRLLGALGEQTAGRYLREHGYTICASNYQTAAGELDIVAEKDGTLCVVEVKTRQAGGFLPPSAAVSKSAAPSFGSLPLPFLTANFLSASIRQAVGNLFSARRAKHTKLLLNIQKKK